ncbi:Ku protein [Pleomorphomonas diazotrophica]|uniref:Non-homologous end joining protein Ku n=1 Tax=Pleomorphomonas diazotrophica TaxID=1166257 RepID=A0A1I4U8P1_9HYPH|nr:Ku protein [Pleomorphomonas diazotrophica]PKR91247.1 Ku protein [Pleomorphomonas diazotrophica]SFM85386.1 DNA end-binding protein Ku [Pleomorphomonas diazotrophica]
MVPRANWKGVLKIAEVICPVSLYTAASTSERIVFHTLNRATGNRVERQYIDAETEKPVDREDQVKGYEVSEGNYIELTPDEVKAAVPESDKTLAVSAFIGCGDIDDVYFDKPYYLAPSDRVAEEAYAIIRDGLREKKVAAIARTLLFRRVRTLLIRPHEDGLIATTLNFDYEVRAAADEFREIPDLKIKDEMLELAEHIIDTKMGEFDITKFDDRYEAALADVVKAKIEGRKIKPRKAPREEKVIDLMAALRESAGLGKSKDKAGSASRSGSRRKAG